MVTVTVRGDSDSYFFSFIVFSPYFSSIENHSKAFEFLVQLFQLNSSKKIHPVFKFKITVMVQYSTFVISIILNCTVL